MERDKELQDRVWYREIWNAKYRYKYIRTAKKTEYVEKEGKEGNQGLIASIRCG